MKHPRFKPCFRVEVMEPDTVFLLTEDTYRVINGRVYKQLAPLLDGTQTLETIMAQMSATVSPMEVLRAITVLEERGYLSDEAAAVPPGVAAFWHEIGSDAVQAKQRLAQQSVTLKALGNAKEDAVQSALELLDITIAEDAHLDIVLTDDYMRPELAAINRAALASGRPWVLAKMVGATIWIGPLFTPGTTACWACMAQRIHGNRQVESYLLRKTGRQMPLPTSRAALPATVTLGAQMLATEVSKWLVQGQNPRLQNRLITFNTLTTQSQSHVVVRRPQCPVCGDAALRESYAAPRKIELASSPKKHTVDGGHRTCPPEEMVARFEQQISPITGVISSLQDMLGGPSGLAYSYIAGHNFAMISDDISILRTNLRSRSGGKGMTDIQARASAIGESIERYSGVYRSEGEVVRRASYRDFGPGAIHINDCMLFSEKQYANRHDWNRKLHARFHAVPNPFDETKEIDWTPLWSLTNQEFKYLPTAYCYFGHPELQQFFCASDSNGCAAGNTLEEAILQGFFEVVERDSVAIWWYNRIQRPAVAVETFALAGYYRKLQEYYRQLNRTLWVIDLTTDTQIPVFVAVSGRQNHSTEDIIIGLGAHFDPSVAIARALTELNQFLPSVIATTPEGTTWYGTEDLDAVHWLKTATFANEAYLVPHPDLPIKTAADYPQLAKDDLRDDVLTCVELARQVGLEVLVLDQTRPDVGLPVCRVMVPGMRHFWRRLGPGRLYDVPVKLGWLAAPIPEEQLNPFSMFF